MKFKKPDFWDYKKPNFIAYFLLPFTYLINLINFIYKKEKIKTDKIKTFNFLLSKGPTFHFAQ